MIGRVLVFLLVGGVFGRSVDQNYYKKFEWGYGKDDGPQVWGKYYPECNGLSQSPIVLPTVFSDAPFLKRIQYHDWAEALKANLPAYIVNDGKFVTWRFNTTFSKVHPSISGSIFGQKERFLFEKNVVRVGTGENVVRVGTGVAGSEHGMNGQFYPGEIQWYWYNSKFNSFEEASESPGNIVITAGFFEIVNYENPLTNDYFDNLYKINGTRIPAVIPWEGEPYPPTFDKKNKCINCDYYFYEGSLSTPPCSEGALWHVYMSTFKVSERQINLLRSLLSSETHEPLVNNIRYVQATNFRDVLQHQEKAPEDYDLPLPPTLPIPSQSYEGASYPPPSHLKGPYPPVPYPGVQYPSEVYQKVPEHKVAYQEFPYPPETYPEVPYPPQDYQEALYPPQDYQEVQYPPQDYQEVSYPPEAYLDEPYHKIPYPEGLSLQKAYHEGSYPQIPYPEVHYPLEAYQDGSHHQMPNPGVPYPLKANQEESYPQMPYPGVPYPSEAHEEGSYPQMPYPGVPYPPEANQEESYPQMPYPGVTVPYPSEAHKEESYPQMPYPGVPYPAEANQEDSYPQMPYQGLPYPSEAYQEGSYPQMPFPGVPYPPEANQEESYPQMPYPGVPFPPEANQEESYSQMPYPGVPYPSESHQEGSYPHMHYPGVTYPQEYLQRVYKEKTYPPEAQQKEVYPNLEVPYPYPQAYKEYPHKHNGEVSYPPGPYPPGPHQQHPRDGRLGFFNPFSMFTDLVEAVAGSSFNVAVSGSRGSDGSSETSVEVGKNN